MNITAGKYKGQCVVAPSADITRPTLSKIRMSVFNVLQSMIDFEGKSFLDTYCGSGIMSLEALSRGFSKVYAIEKNNGAYFIAKKNFSKFSSDNNLTLFLGDSLLECKKLKENFDVIYIDPPYYEGIYEKSLESVKDISSGIIILEHVTDINIEGFEIIKQKKYSQKFLTFLKRS